MTFIAPPKRTRATRISRATVPDARLAAGRAVYLESLDPFSSRVIILSLTLEKLVARFRKVERDAPAILDDSGVPFLRRNFSRLATYSDQLVVAIDQIFAVKAEATRRRAGVRSTHPYSLEAVLRGVPIAMNALHEDIDVYLTDALAEAVQIDRAARELHGQGGHW